LQWVQAQIGAKGKQRLPYDGYVLLLAKDSPAFWDFFVKRKQNVVAVSCTEKQNKVVANG